MRGTFDRRRVRRESLPEDDLRHPAPTQAHGQAASSGDARCDDILRTTSSKVYRRLENVSVLKRYSIVKNDDNLNAMRKMQEGKKWLLLQFQLQGEEIGSVAETPTLHAWADRIEV
jgi:hypothetical protein